MMWSSTYYFEVTVHQIFADLCPFESFCKLFTAYCLEVIVYKFYFITGIFFASCFCGVSSIRKHFSLEAANFSLFSQEGEVTSSLIPGPAWSLRLQFTKYQQRYAPMKFLIFFFFFFVIPLTVYIRSTELYRSQFLCYIFLLATGI